MGSTENEISSPEICIVWDNENFPEWLIGKATGKVHDRKSFEKQKFEEFDLIYLLAESTWGRKLRSDFYGFKIGRELREKHNVLCPIIFCSFLKPEHFFSLKIEGSEILNYPGHYELQLPDKPETDKYKGIDNDTLEDINLSLFNEEQIVHNLMHNTEDALPGLIYSFEQEGIAVMKEKASELLRKQLQVFGQKIEQGNENKFNSVCKEFIENICTAIDSLKTEETFLLSDAQTLRQPFKLFKPQLYDLLPKKMQEGLAEPAKLKRWQVLFIDDEPFNCLGVENHFKTNGITCHTATNPQDAFKILKEDKSQSNRISIIIADFRLYENGNSEKGIWQDLQGYRILEEIHSNPDFKSQYVYAILTSKTGTIQKRIQKHSKFPVLWFSKSDVLGGGISSFNLFCQRVLKIGDDAFIRKMTLPNYGGWITQIGDKVDEKLNYSYLYKMHVETNDYETAEVEILSSLNVWKECFPEDAVLQPSFNFKKKEPQVLLQIFRRTILPFRLLFLYKKYIENYSFKDLYFFFNPKYKDKYVDKKEISAENIKADKELFEAMRSLFTNNWGFPIEKDLIVKENDTIRHQKEDELLFEENQFLILSGIKLHQFDSTDEVILKDFLVNLIKVGFDTHTKDVIGLFIGKLDSGLSVTYSEIRFLLNKLKPEIMNNKILEDAFYRAEMINDCLYGNCSHSQILRSLIETFVAEIENG